jgi:GH24 family phage-related lysozyme (muramidase)
VKVSDKLIEMIKHDEGVVMRPYQCPALLWTVGVGHVIDPMHARVKLEDRKTLPIPTGWDRTFSMAEVNDILKKDLNRFETGVMRLCPKTTKQAQFDALVSFAFNVGLGNLQNSTLRMKHNREEFGAAAEEFLKWNKAGGKVLKGLDKRRRGEKALYES